MATVSSLVVRRRLATMRQVEDALARQVLYGGDVVTNLLEVAPPPATDEVALTQALAESLEIGAAPIDALRAPDPVAVGRVSRELAEQHGFVPIALSGAILRVALAEPLAPDAVQTLEAALGLKIEQRVASLARLRQALEQAYGIVMDRRTRRLVSVLDGLKDQPPSVPPPPRRTTIPDVDDVGGDGPVRPATVVAKVMARKPSAPPAAMPVTPSAEPAPVDTPGAPTLETTIRDKRGAAGWFLKQRRTASSQRLPAAKRRRGPFTREEAEAVFAEAASTEAVLGAVLDYAQQYFAACALFLAHEQLAEGFDARGLASPERVRKMGVPLDLPSQLADARTQRVPLVRARSKDGLDGVFSVDLDRASVEGDVLIAPMVVGKRVVALLYADDDGQPITLADLAEPLRILSAGGTALARIIVRRKRQQAGPLPDLPLPTPPAAPVERKKASFAERAQALTRALVGGRVPNKSTRPPSWAPGSFSAAEPDPVQAASLAPIVSPVEGHPDTGRADDGTPTATSPPVESQESAPRPVQVARVVPQARLMAIDLPPEIAKNRKVTQPGFGAVRVAETLAKEAAKEAAREEATAAAPTSGRRPSGPRLALADPDEVGALGDLESGDSDPLGLPDASFDEAEPTPLVTVPARRPGPSPELLAQQAPPPSLRGRRPLGPTIPREEPEIKFTGSPPYPGSAVTTEPDLIETADVSDDELEELLALAGRESERFEVYQPRPLPRATGRVAEAELPKVMVALEPEHVAVVTKLLRGGEASDEAARELVAMGVLALPALMDRFPGPTRCDRTVPLAEVPPPREAGPLLRVLSELGRASLREILARLGDPTPETRFWAVWMLTEITDPEAAAPLVPRLVDDDLAVRRAACFAARMVARLHPHAAEFMVEPLVGVVLDPGGGIALRVRAAHALGEIRDKHAAEGLVLGLEAREGEIVQACHDALVILTRHDATRKGGSWPRWLHAHGDKPRMEWLIDALLDEDLSIREGAGHELKELTKQYFGYYANLPRSEREQAQKRYRAWWDTEGRELLGGAGRGGGSPADRPSRSGQVAREG